MGSRLRLTAADRQLLRAVGEHLAVARGHDMAAALRGESQNARAKDLNVTFGIHSRYAGSVVRANDAQVKLAREGLWRHKLSLQRGIATLERRLAASTRQSCRCEQRRHCDVCKDGYATRNEWWTKRRRLDVLRARLVETDRRLTAKDYAIVFGGRGLLGTRHHLTQAGLTLALWQQQWNDQRLFLTCVGNVGKTGGNPCLTLTQDADGKVWLTVSVPEPVQRRLGVAARVRLTHPVPVGHVPELVERVTARAGTAISISFEAGKRGEKVLLRASWTHEQASVVPTLAQLRSGRVVSLDLNADHLALARLNPDGNPVGPPIRIPLELTGLGAGTRDARVREAISQVLLHAKASDAVAVVVEELGFEAEKTREKHGRKKTFRALLSGFPTAAFRNRLVPMAYRQGLAVIAVDPRYTSKAGGRDWQHILAGGPVGDGRLEERRDPARRCCGRDRPAWTRARPDRQHTGPGASPSQGAEMSSRTPPAAATDGDCRGWKQGRLVRPGAAQRQRACQPKAPHPVGSSGSQQSASPFGVHPCPSGRAWQR